MNSAASDRLRFDHRPFGNDPVPQISPQGDQQLARQRHNPNPSQPTAAGTKPLLVPAAQLAFRLESQSTPSNFNCDAANVPIAGFADPLLVGALPALIGRWC